MLWFAIFSFIFLPGFIAADDIPTLPGNCTLSYLHCDPLADCELIDGVEQSFRCICSDGTYGDGLAGAGYTGCTRTEFPCTQDSNCHPQGFCNTTDPSRTICNCQEGYSGDGKHACVDIDECADEPCSPNARCHNTRPGFTCVCLPLYTGDGFQCTRTCSVSHDCYRPNGDCVDNYCKCNAGYEGDGVSNCTDINECDTGDYTCAEPSVCQNTDGSYKCTCPNGYVEQGDTCRKLPINCHDIYENDPSAVSGRIYEIDPDGTDPLDIMKVKCIFENGIGITIVEPVQRWPQYVSDQEKPINYKDASPESVKGLVDNSEFCYQTQWIECYSGYNLHQDGVFSWRDAQGVAHSSWGGSGVNGKCACGVLGYCDKGESCYCDGSTTAKVSDFGKNMDRSQIPAVSVKFKAQSGSRKARYLFSEVKCGPKPFDLLRNCDEIKDDGVDDDGPQVIDIDGPDGPLQPTLVHCDMNSYDHVGITVLPHDQQDPIIPTQSGSVPLTYVTPEDILKGVISGLAFCSQDIKYSCRNAPIHLNGNQIVSVSVGTDSRQLNYFPGGQGVPLSCGCGTIDACATKDVKCNCDMNDNVTRYDLGVQTIKDDLPITSITLQSGANVYVNVEIGPLMCAKDQFGFEPNCEKYRATGKEYEYAYLIDPDGPVNPKRPNDLNVQPYMAECLFTDYPPQGVTVIHHESEEWITVTSTDFIFNIAYLRASRDQIEQLKARSTFCVQSLSFDCNNYNLHLADGSGGLVWKDLNGNSYTYLSGGGETPGCQCNQDNSCQDSKICNCDANGILQDINVLANITHLPVGVLDFSAIKQQTGNLKFKLGPLKCYETFQSCYDLWAYMRTKSLIGEKPVEVGKYTIDPDTNGPVQAFTVTCNFPFTVVPVETGPRTSPSPGESECFEVKYKDTSGRPISREQITSLVKHSRACQQYLSYSCKNAWKTGHVNYSTCDGTVQPGWALSEGHDTCSCGMVGRCNGGEACNCDIEDGKTRKDGGYIYSTKRLPVCEVCMALDGIDPSNPLPGGNRYASFHVGTLNCLGYEFGGKPSCQERRLFRSESDVYYTDPDAKYGGIQPFPVWCEMINYPAMGIMEIHPRKTQWTIPPNQSFNVSITYYVYSLDYVEKLIDKSEYCTQEISISCNDGSLDLSGSYGWYSRDGISQDSWGGNIGSDVKCEGSGVNCNCNLDGVQVDGGLLGNKDLLPTSRVVLGPSPTERVLTVGPVKCTDIKRDCYAIMKSGNTKTPYKKNSTYIIDPDGPGGVDPFIVKCYFDSRNDNAITEVLPVPEDSGSETVTGRTDPHSYEIPYV